MGAATQALSSTFSTSQSGPRLSKHNQIIMQFGKVLKDIFTITTSIFCLLFVFSLFAGVALTPNWLVIKITKILKLRKSDTFLILLNNLRHVTILT